MLYFSLTLFSHTLCYTFFLYPIDSNLHLVQRLGVFISRDQILSFDQDLTVSIAHLPVNWIESDGTEPGWLNCLTVLWINLSLRIRATKPRIE